MGRRGDFVPLAADLDVTRQQAWFAYYASGDSIEKSGHQMAQEVKEAMRGGEIVALTVVAHKRIDWPFTTAREISSLSASLSTVAQRVRASGRKPPVLDRIPCTDVCDRLNKWAI